MWDFPPLFSPHKFTNYLCLSLFLPLPVTLPPIHVHVTVYRKPTELFAPWKNIPLINFLKHRSDLAQFVQSRFFTRWNVLRLSESSGLGSRFPCEIHYRTNSHNRRRGRRSKLLIGHFEHFRPLVPCSKVLWICNPVTVPQSNCFSKLRLKPVFQTRPIKIMLLLRLPKYTQHFTRTVF